MATRIIQTVNYGNDIKKISEVLENAKRNKVEGIRFNFCRYTIDEWNMASECLSDVMNKYANDFEFAIDIPYPRNKARILRNYLEGSKVYEEKRYRIISDASYKKGNLGDIIVSISDFSTLDKENYIYYADGEGAFEIIDAARDVLVVKAMNSFRIWDGKSISCGLLHADDRIYEILRRFEAIKINRKIVLFLSFVESAKEVIDLKKKIDMNRFFVVSKIESVNSIQELSKIIYKSDGILLARGDMALYMSQFNLLEICRKISKENKGKRLFAATDILHGLQDSMLPSRAEMMDYYLLMELGCTDIVLANYLHNSERLYKYIRDMENNR